MLLRAAQHGQLDLKLKNADDFAFSQVSRKELARYAIQKGDIPEFLSDVALDGQSDGNHEYISLNEATTRAYEETEGTLVAGIAESPYPGSKRNVLSWYAVAFVGSDYLTPIFGKMPPSRIRRLIPPNEIRRCDFSDDARTLSRRDDEEPRFVELEIKKTDFLERLAEIKTWSGDQWQQ